MRLRVYFDTNIFAAIARAGELADVRRVLIRTGADVWCTYGNLMETIGAGLERRPRLEVMRALCTRFVETSTDYLEAKEFIAELRRIRPHLVRPWSRDVTAKRLLRNRKKAWSEIVATGDLEPPLGHETFQELSRSGNLERKAAYKEVRTVLRASDLEALDVFPQWSDPARMADVDAALRAANPIDRLVRFLLFSSWSMALEGDPRLRDLRDWVKDTVLLNRCTQYELATFWFRDADLNRMPHTLWHGLVGAAQFRKRPELSDQADAAHLEYLACVDLFLTADRRFFEIIEEAVSRYPEKSRLGKAFFLDQREPLSPQIAAMLP